MSTYCKLSRVQVHLLVFLSFNLVKSIIYFLGYLAAANLEEPVELGSWIRAYNYAKQILEANSILYYSAHYLITHFSLLKFTVS